MIKMFIGIHEKYPYYYYYYYYYYYLILIKLESIEIFEKILKYQIS
jgi:hypothetical protein